MELIQQVFMPTTPQLAFHPHEYMTTTTPLLNAAEQSPDEVGEHGHVPVDEVPGVERRRRQVPHAVPAALHLRDPVPVHLPEVPLSEPAPDQRGDDGVHGARGLGVGLPAERVRVPLGAGQGAAAAAEQRAHGARGAVEGRQGALGRDERVEVGAVGRVGDVPHGVPAELVHEQRAGRLPARGVHGHGREVGARGRGREGEVERGEEGEVEEEEERSWHGHELELSDDELMVNFGTYIYIYIIMRLIYIFFGICFKSLIRIMTSHFET
jgi:hypothetical protein